MPRVTPPSLGSLHPITDEQGYAGPALWLRQLQRQIWKIIPLLRTPPKVSWGFCWDYIRARLPPVFSPAPFPPPRRYWSQELSLISRLHANHCLKIQPVAGQQEKAHLGRANMLPNSMGRLFHCARGKWSSLALCNPKPCFQSVPQIPPTTHKQEFTSTSLHTLPASDVGFCRNWFFHCCLF